MKRHFAAVRAVDAGGPQRRGWSFTRLAMFLLIAMTLSWGAALHAQPSSDAAPLEFENSLEETRFNALVSELRCVMCQNQSLADSNAQIAVDLRREVLTLIREGRGDEEIRQFLVQRYGEFVLYRPQVGAKTWLLWFGPALVLAGGALLVFSTLRSRRARPSSESINDEQEW